MSEERFVITVRPLHESSVPAETRLKKLLKRLLRPERGWSKDYAFRCLDIKGDEEIIDVTPHPRLDDK